MRRIVGFRGRARAVAAELMTAVAIVVFAFIGLSSSSERIEESTLSEEVSSFNAGLERFRRGDDNALPELLACAERCGAKGRKDLTKLVGFFTRIRNEDRIQGHVLEGEFAKVYWEVKADGDNDLPADKWREKRPKILDRLNQIILRSMECPDFTAAARAHAFRATILRRRVVEDDEIDEASRAEYIANGIRDAKSAIELFDRIGMLKPELEAEWNLAWFSWANDHWTTSETAFQQLLSNAVLYQSNEYQAKSIEGLLRISQDSGDIYAVSDLLNELAGVVGKNGSWNLTKRQAGVLMAMDEPERAVDCLVKGKPARPSQLKQWHILMAGALARKGDEEAAAAHEDSLRTASANPKPGSVESILLAETDLRKGNAQRVLEELDTTLQPYSLSLMERAELARIRGRAYLMLDRPREAISMLQESVESNALLETRTRLSSDPDSTSSLVGETIGLETLSLLAQAQIQIGNPLTAAKVIEGEQSQVLRRLSQQDAGTITEANVVEWARRFESGLVTWVIGADSSVVVHVDSRGAAAGAVIHRGRKEIACAVRRVRQAAIDGDDALPELARELQEELIPSSILERLRAASTDSNSRVLLCVHGPLEDLPFSVMPLFEMPAGGSVVPVVLPGLQREVPSSPVTAAQLREWTFCGDPLRTDGRPALPGTGSEIAELASLHATCKVRVQQAFDREALSDCLQGSSCLQISTHLCSDGPGPSLVDKRLARASFELSDGQRYGIADIRNDRPHLPLAVLDACETGSGVVVDGQAGMGVARAFLASGTQNLVVTSWPVEDGAAAGFAVELHRALLAGNSPSRAVSAAVASLRRAGRPPADWAAFRLVGQD